MTVDEARQVLGAYAEKLTDAEVERVMGWCQMLAAEILKLYDQQRMRRAS